MNRLLLRWLLTMAVIFCAAGALAAPAKPFQNDEGYIRGYVAAVLEREFQVSYDALAVEKERILIFNLEASPLDRRRIQETLAGLPGVSQVVFMDGEAVPPTRGITPPPAAAPVLFPEDLLFESLLADPRWPHFSASYQRYFDSDQLKSVGAANFGEMFGFYRFGGPWNSLMEIGIQAGVFSIFDLDADSSDLVNADYFVAFPLTVKKEWFSAITRLFHQSSHLGDEFLLRGRARERINLSYEGVDAILSFELPLGFRLYGGGGYLFHREPSDLDPGLTQAGLEFRSPWTLWNGALRPVMAVDLQSREESDWGLDVSARTGIQFEDPVFRSRKLQLLLEYYNGRSPNGQFYREHIELLGLGLHFFYD